MQNLMMFLNGAVDAGGTASGGGFTMEVNGPMVIAEFELFGRTFVLTESVTVQWVVMIGLALLFFFLGRNLKIKPDSRRQAIAEMIVGMFSGLVSESMGAKYKKYTAYIGGLFCFSALNSLSGLLGFRAPTSDISVIAAWGIITFVLVQRNRFKTGGIFGGLKSLTEPIVFMTPMNLVSEIAGPMSQTFRHFGNILAGFIIGSIIYAACTALIGAAVVIPALASLYFDIFGAIVQAFIFITLTMVYVSMASCDPDEE